MRRQAVKPVCPRFAAHVLARFAAHVLARFAAHGLARFAAHGLAAAVAAIVVVASACDAEETRVAFPITFLAQADEPLAGVEIRIEGGPRLGVTGADGVLRVTLTEREGTMVPFRVACPAGFRGPREMPLLTLRRFTGLAPAGAQRGIEVSVDCPPAQRLAALVVRSGHPGLPVLAQGREVMRTGPDGIAHALIALPPDSTFRVVLDTSRFPDLRPESPATTLALADRNDIFVIDQEFELAEPPPAAPEEPAPRRPRSRRRRPPPASQTPPPPPPPTERPSAPEQLK